MTNYRVNRWTGFDGPAVSPTPKGPILFEKVRALVKDHVFWPHEWCYDLASLWVMQAHVTWGLNSVFYLLFSGTFGGGKTTGLDVLAGLTGAVNASDISVAALVTELDSEEDRPMVLDEFDVKRDAERDSAISAICRNGYTRGKPYIRNDPRSRSNYSLPTFGAKAIGFRKAVDDALEDRGFVLPCGKYIGPDGFRFVQNNDGFSLGELPRELEAWGKTCRVSKDILRREFKSPDWAKPVERVVGREFIGANRESQLTSVALQVCRLCCIELDDSLRSALDLRRESAAANTPVLLQESREVLDGLLVRQATLASGLEVFVVRQGEFTTAVNARRKDRGERQLTSTQIAGLRNDLGIDPSWLTHPQNRTFWNIPVGRWTRSGGQANLPNQANPLVIDGMVSQVSLVSQGAPPRPHLCLEAYPVGAALATEPGSWMEGPVRSSGGGAE